MAKDAFLKTIRVPPKSYVEFIMGDRGQRHAQTATLLGLLELQKFYVENEISDASFSDPAEFSKKNSVDWAFELFLMRKAVADGRPHVFNNSVSPVLTRQANQVLLLAMLRGHAQIVSYFLSHRLVDVNQSILGPRYWPSYFLLACTCPGAVYAEFARHWANPGIAWNGLTPSLLSVARRDPIEKLSCMDFVTYPQFALLNRFRGVCLVQADAPLPIFLLDVACMVSDRRTIKHVLDVVPEAGYLSRLSFVVQSEEHLILILSRYGFRTEQQFNGSTPLHYSCYNNDFCILSILLYIDFPIRQDRGGLFPNEVGSHKMREKTSIFFNLCAGIPVRRDPDGQLVRVFSHASFIENMASWMRVLKYNPNEFDKYTGIFRYLDFNKHNKIVRRSRFNIINVFSLAKSPVSVERCVQKALATPHVPRTHGASETLVLYSRYFG